MLRRQRLLTRQSGFDDGRNLLCAERNSAGTYLAIWQVC